MLRYTGVIASFENGEITQVTIEAATSASDIIISGSTLITATTINLRQETLGTGLSLRSGLPLSAVVINAHLGHEDMIVDVQVSAPLVKWTSVTLQLAASGAVKLTPTCGNANCFLQLIDATIILGGKLPSEVDVRRNITVVCYYITHFVSLLCHGVTHLCDGVVVIVH
jgi:hypothetical protein